MLSVKMVRICIWELEKFPLFRGGGTYFLVKHPVLTKEEVVGILSEILDKTKIDKFMEDLEIDFSYDFRGEARLRGNAFFKKVQSVLLFD